MVKINHLVFVPLSIVSHTRSELNLAIQLLHLHPSLIITWIVTSYGLPLLQKELLLHPPHVVDRLKHRFRPLELADTLGLSKASFSDDLVVAEKFPEVLHSLLTDAGGGSPFSTRPCMVILDLFRSNIITTVRKAYAKLDLDPIPCLAIMPSMAFTAFRYVAHEINGGVFEHLGTRAQAYLDAGLSHDAAAHKAYGHIKGDLLHLPGLPPMYDYECSPHMGARSEAPDIRMACEAYRNAHEADGTIWLSTPEVETDELRLLAGDLGHPTFAVGSQLSKDWLEYACLRPADTEQDRAVHDFLGSALRRFGPESLVYVSFGTLYWPNDRPDIIRTIVKCLVASQKPFIIAKGPAGFIEPEQRDAIAQSARGILVDWAPQVKVLQHKATGIFLSHCGCGAVLEAISSGVPMIGLPFGSEQPLMAAHYMDVQQIGVRLCQFATGLDGMPLGNGSQVLGTPEAMRDELSSALEKLQGDSRQPFLEKLAALRDIMTQSTESGLAKKAMLDLAAYFTAV